MSVSRNANLEVAAVKKYFYKLPADAKAIQATLRRSSNVEPPFESLELYLKSQSLIRVLVDNGANFGNQAANVNLVRWLRASGYEGKIELIYAMRSSNEVDEGNIGDKKIALLFDLPMDILKGKPAYYSPSLKIEFIEINEFLARLSQDKVFDVGLSFTAASDPTNPEWYLERTANTSLPVSLDLYNYANFMRANIFIKLSPYWHQDNLRHDTQLFIKDQPLPIILEGSQSQMLITPLPDLKAAIDYTLNTSAGLRTVVKYPGLPHLLTRIQSEAIDFMPIYGITIRESTANFYKIIDAVSRARTSSVITRPLILGLFFEIEEPFLDEFKKHVKTLNDFFKKVKVKYRLRMLSLSSADSIQQLNHLQITDIVVLRIGAVPKIIFDSIFSLNQKNMWPAVREGASSLVPVLASGRPHLHCNRDKEAWDIDLKLASPDVRKKLEAVNKNLCTDSYISKNGEINVIIDFLFEVQKPDSPVVKFFQELKQVSLQANNDRIANALHAAMELSAHNPYQSQRALCSILHSAKFIDPARGREKWFMFKPAKVSFKQEEKVEKPKPSLVLPETPGFLTYYFQELCHLIRSCETYFPPNVPHLWSSGASCQPFRPVTGVGVESSALLLTK